MEDKPLLQLFLVSASKNWVEGSHEHGHKINKRCEKRLTESPGENTISEAEILLSYQEVGTLIIDLKMSDLSDIE